MLIEASFEAPQAIARMIRVTHFIGSWRTAEVVFERAMLFSPFNYFPLQAVANTVGRTFANRSAVFVSTFSTQNHRKGTSHQLILIIGEK